MPKIDAGQFAVNVMGSPFPDEITQVVPCMVYGVDIPGRDEQEAVLVISDEAVARGVVESNPGKYVRLQVVVSPAMAQALLSGEVEQCSATG